MTNLPSNTDLAAKEKIMQNVNIANGKRDNEGKWMCICGEESCNCSKMLPPFHEEQGLYISIQNSKPILLECVCTPGYDCTKCEKCQLINKNNEDMS